MQKWLVTLLVLSTATTVVLGAKDEHCYNEVHALCSETAHARQSCTAKYGGANDALFNQLKSYISQHVLTNFKYLFMSANFGNYVRNRDGFAKLFRKLSDESWDDAISLIKLTTKRGGSADFTLRVDSANLGIENDEVKALSKALDLYKNLANEGNSIHREIGSLEKTKHDAEVVSYFENELAHKHAKTIRDLAGYTTDMINLSKVPNPGLSVFMFDEYLQKVLS